MHSTSPAQASDDTHPTPTRKTPSWHSTLLIFSVLAPVAIALLIYQLDTLNPAPLPLHELTQPVAAAPKRNAHILKGSEFVGAGALVAPEDVAYDPKSGLIYTGCADGWVKRVTLNDSAADSVVENWVFTGGRPLGLAHGDDKEVYVADTEKGLLKISEEGIIELLTDEAEGVKFKLTDCVDVAEDGMIYFTDASYKYSLDEFILDILEGRPYGRFLSYNPLTKETKVLVRNLYFANGVAVSPDQNYVIFCETVMRRCRKYYLQGSKKGSVENFIDQLPGTPDNIRYDGEGHYWIALATDVKPYWDLALRYPFIRKVLAIVKRYAGGWPHLEKNAGVFVVNLDGEPIAHYSDPELFLITSGIKIGKYLYCGSVFYPYIIRLDLDRHPAHATT
ncbi:protein STRICTOSIDINE SYNTHASE-LIKE 7 [Pyrus x bretschneideri]|uniref:protein STRICTOSIDINE SYNTHASE-LIKE 7 n=1 Tax=Pyrus x bretschneideri TaxID=225117 RepID=UPI00202FC8C0|nr:protein STRICTOSIDINE SYNTHASE-LIKE 7 [Pyrus x bretschneideri]